MNSCEVFINLIASALNPDIKFRINLNDAELELVKKDAFSHDLYKLVNSSPFFAHELSDAEVTSDMKAMLRENFRNSELLEINKSLKSKGVNLIFLKGSFLKSLYPSPLMRTMGDVDVFCDLKDFSEILDFLHSRGYIHKNESEGVTAFFKKGFYPIELHTKLMFDTTELLPVFCSTDTPIELDGLSFLDYTSHLIYILCHMAKHFFRGGVGIRQLCDVYLFVLKCGNLIDLENFFSRIEKLGCKTFFANLLLIYRRYFMLDISEFEQYITAEKDISQLLLYDIYSCGSFGGKNRSNMYRGIIASGSVINSDKKANGLFSIVNTLFPKRIKDVRYSYSVKYPFLLPAAWLHRGFVFLFTRFKWTDLKIIFSKKTSDTVSDRLKLLKDLGFIK